MPQSALSGKTEYDQWLVRDRVMDALIRISGNEKTFYSCAPGVHRAGADAMEAVIGFLRKEMVYDTMLFVADFDIDFDDGRRKARLCLYTGSLEFDSWQVSFDDTVIDIRPTDPRWMSTTTVCRFILPLHWEDVKRHALAASRRDVYKAAVKRMNDFAESLRPDKNPCANDGNAKCSEDKP